MTEIDGVVERAYREGGNIVAVCRKADGTYLEPCVIPVGSEKHKYLVDQFNMSDPSQVHNIPATFTVRKNAILDAERKQTTWYEDHLGTPGI